MQDEPGGRGCFACKMSLERDRPCWVLTIKVSNKPGMSLDEIRVFLKASEAVPFVVLQPLLEFPPAVRRAGAGDQRQRKGTETVPLVCHSLRNPAPVAGRSGVPEGRFDDPGDGRLGAAANGHAGGHRHASSQTEVVRELFRTADSMRRITRATSACEGAQPPVGRPCGTTESSGIKTQKPSNEKENQNHPSPRRCPASRWSALR